MNANAEKWVAALRSGQYNQTEGVLHRTDGSNGDPVGFCCLGVACDLYIKDGNDLATVQAGHAVEYGPNEDRYSLPEEVQEWLNLATVDGEIIRDGTLAGHNDSGKAFDEIATIIESEPEGLFEA